MKDIIRNIEMLPESKQKDICDKIGNALLQAKNIQKYTPNDFLAYIDSEIQKDVKVMNDMERENEDAKIRIKNGYLPDYLNMSFIYVLHKEHIKALGELKVLRCSNINEETQSLSQKSGQKQVSKSTRRKGNPKKMLKDRMIDDADGSKLQKIHKVMDGKTGRDAALIILACIKIGWMLKPTFTEVEKEFGDIGSRQGFTNNLKEEKFQDVEIEGAINSLKSA